jgi:tRNA G18 (ribose-2'-O)-methylase SpoU
MGSIFARPPARARFEELAGTTIALDQRGEQQLGRAVAELPVVLCVGAERKGLPQEILDGASATARIPMRESGPTSLNAAVSAAIGLWEVTRMAADA